jgi:iron complex outermembrane recepter protein
MLLVCSLVDAAGAEVQNVDLRLATLEELMKIEVTSASRREQPAGDVPAAVYVITRDEIRRSGLTSIPELLRLAPGVQVARINSNKWAVSVRGFNGRLYSNKLLVMIDGRSIYNPAFSTVLWDTEDLLIEDIDHIEVIRGPGGAMWGANAVNGVINIITRSSTQTNGSLARVGVGTFDTSNAAFRYGGSLGDVHYRLFAQGSAYGDSLTTEGLRADDNWRSVTTGFRTDWYDAQDALMFQGTATSGRQRPLWFGFDPVSMANSANAVVSETTTANAVARWTRTTAAGASFQAQAYFDHAHRNEAIANYNRRTWDVDAQYHTTLATNHEFVGGGGYRYISEVMRGRGAYTFTPDRLKPVIVNAFAQDTIRLIDSRLEVTLGAKFEHNAITGPAFQPTTRLMWKASTSQRAWAAVSRALRTPSLIDLGVHVEYPAPLAIPALQLRREIGSPAMPVLIGAVGNPDFRNERLLDAEAGYRLNLAQRASIDIVAFGGRYHDLQTFEPQPPVVELLNGRPVMRLLSRHENFLQADTRGVEVSGRVQLGDDWQIDSALATFHLTPHPNGSLDPAVQDYDGHTPAYQWRTHVAMPLTARGQADLHFFHTGPIEAVDVPAFARLDARVEWSLSAQLALIASGQNLLQASHVEFNGDRTVLESTLVPRSGGLRLVWRF